MKLDPGELRERIYIEEEVTTPDGSGGSTTEWQTKFGPLWAHVRPMRGTERGHAGQQQAESLYKVFIRTRDIDPAYRIRWGSNGNRILNIRFVAHSPRDEFMPIDAELGVQQ